MPITIGAPQPDMSPIRAAGRPPIRTVTLPITIGDGGCGPARGGIVQATMSPITAAGKPPIRTFGTPGPVIIPGWPIGSRMRAAGGISFSLKRFSLVDLHQSARDIDGGRGQVHGCAGDQVQIGCARN